MVDFSNQIKKMQMTDIENNSNAIILPLNLQLSNTHHQQMTSPQQPIVKILKRPQKDNTPIENAIEKSKVQVQVKSLEQRKQEYAEARLRILGKANDKDLNDDNEGNSSSNSTKLEVSQKPEICSIADDIVIRQ